MKGIWRWGAPGRRAWRKESEERKVFFFEKKKQKTFAIGF
jgi:hypothetical protein